MRVVLVLNEFLVDAVCLNTLRAKSAPMNLLILDHLHYQEKQEYPPSRKQLHEIMLELHGVTADMRARVFSNREHLTQVRLGLGMAFETVLVSALLLADLAVPS